VDLRIFDIGGRLVRTLASGGFKPAGSYRAYWDGLDDDKRPVASGGYICRLRTESRVAAIRLVIVK
jgi:hypothetical protein